MKTIVAVTGSAGHLCQALVDRLLLAGRDVRAISPGRIDAVVGADVVFHLEGRVSIAAGDDLFGPVDLGGTTDLLDACVTGGVRRLVYVSSVAALIPDGPAGPATSEQLLARAMADGLDAVVVYPTAVIGPGDPGRGHLNRMLLDLWQRRTPAPVGGGFDWVDVRDVAAGIAAAESEAPAGGRYLLNGHWATIEDLLARAAEVVEVPPWPNRLPREPSEASIDVLDEDDPFDAARARRDLGYVPRPLDQTLRDTHAWFVARGLVRAAGAARQLVPA